MIEYRAVEHVGLMTDGHGHSPDELQAAAEQWATNQAGLTPLAARKRFSRVELYAEAWWGGDAVGFCQEHHDGAVPVTAVAVPELVLSTGG